MRTETSSDRTMLVTADLNTTARRAPSKDVVEVRELEGPKGGRLLVMQLECGHLVWQRRKRPPRSLRCVSCWLGQGVTDDRAEERKSRRRPEASLHGSRSREEVRQHDRGKNPRTGLPRQRMPGTNGSWPASGQAPKPPAIMNLVEDLAELEELPEAVFGQYPRGLIAKLLPHLRCKRSEILHVCSGSLPPGEGTRVDVRPEAKPDILADGRDLPIEDGSVAAVLIDPPYTHQYAQDLYGVEYPRPAHLLREAARVVRPCGRIGLVHYIVAMPPPGCHVIRVLGLSTGLGFSMRAVTIYQREQDRLL